MTRETRFDRDVPPTTPQPTAAPQPAPRMRWKPLFWQTIILAVLIVCAALALLATLAIGLPVSPWVPVLVVSAVAILFCWIASVGRQAAEAERDNEP